MDLSLSVDTANSCVPPRELMSIVYIPMRVSDRLLFAARPLRLYDII